MWSNPSIWIPSAVIGIGFLTATYGTIRATKLDNPSSVRRSGLTITGAGLLAALAGAAALLLTN